MLVLPLVVMMEEEDFSDKLFSDIIENVYIKLKRHIERELETNPYAIVRVRWLKKMLQGRRGAQFILRRLSKEYSITKMGSWYIIRPKSDKK